MARRKRAPVRKPIPPSSSRPAAGTTRDIALDLPDDLAAAVVIKPATAADDLWIDRLRREHLPYTPHERQAPQARDDALRSPLAYLLKAETDATPIGLLYSHALHEIPVPTEVSLLKWLVVDPRARGRGVATALIAFARAQLPAGTLWIGGCASAEVDFYRNQGFRVLAAGEPLTSPKLPGPLGNNNRDAPHWFLQQL